MIPATIVTGFLGSGKTTLIRHLLQGAGGKARIAVIVNEFGERGIDGAALRACQSEDCASGSVIELANGCICCTVADDFLPAMQAILSLDPPPDHVVIETSGLALPEPLIRAFNWPEIRTRARVDGVIALIDGEAYARGQFAHDPNAVAAQRAADDSRDHDSSLAELFEEQIEHADMLIVSKTDLLTPEAAKQIMRALEEKVRPAVPVVGAFRGALAPELLLGRGGNAASLPKECDHDHAHDHDAFESFALSLPQFPERAAFEARLRATLREGGILRMKGHAAIEGKAMRLDVQAVGPRLETGFSTPFAPGETRETQLVIIGRHGMARDVIAARIGGEEDAVAPSLTMRKGAARREEAAVQKSAS